MDYSEWTADDLLEALELAGRKPAPDLIRACLSRREELTPGLLEMLQAGWDEDWADDDPRWFRAVHAGLLLIEFREEAALPIFYDIFSDEDGEWRLGEWFDRQFPKYGGAAIPWLVRLTHDSDACQGGRMFAISLLGKIGELQPEERSRVLAEIRNLLPPLLEDGTLVLPADPEEVGDAEVERWSWAIAVLMDLEDGESRGQVLALYREELVDTWIMGDADAYIDAIEGRDRSRSGPDPVDLVTFYENPVQGSTEADEEFEELASEDLARFDEVLEQFQEQTGMSDDEVVEVLEAMASGAVPMDLENFEEDDSFVARSASPVTHPPMPFHAEAHPGRNDPCPCGSGKKYKKCHGRTV